MKEPFSCGKKRDAYLFTVCPGGNEEGSTLTLRNWTLGWL
jgi:hypothetical protein